MIVVDTNVLLYAVNSGARQHHAAHAWLTTVLGDRDTVGLCWTVMLGFIRNSTNRATLPRRLTAVDAFEVRDAWLDSAAATVVEPTTRHCHIVRGLVTESGAAGNLTANAHIAAIAIDYGPRSPTSTETLSVSTSAPWFPSVRALCSLIFAHAVRRKSRGSHASFVRNPRELGKCSRSMIWNAMLNYSPG